MNDTNGNVLPNALIGHSGFVGTTLQKQTTFQALFRSTDIQNIRGGNFGLVVCAGAPAQKWLANREPDEDLRKIKGLIGHLDAIQTRTFVLISTVDVFKSSCGMDEDSPVIEDGLLAYGLHRRMLEKFVEKRFPDHLIVRLPGLVGPGLRKNIIFDFLNSNKLEAIDSRGMFQFYPTVNLWADIQTARTANLKLIHLTAVPLKVAEVAREGFGFEFTQELANAPARYDLRTKHAALFGANGSYQCSRRESLTAIRCYAQSKPCNVKQEA